MAVIPLRRPQTVIIGDYQPPGIATGSAVIEDEPAPEESPETTVSISASGAIDITIGGERAKPRGEDPFDRNLAETMEDMPLAALASHLLESIEADKASRADWEGTANDAAKYLGIRLEDPAVNVSGDGTVSRAVATVLLEAVMKLWSVARAELLPVGGPVKVRRDDTPAVPEEDAAGPGIAPPSMPAGPGLAPAAPPKPDAMSGDQLATALETDLNHFLTVTDREYYPDFSRMLFNRALIGMAFRKVYRCPLKRRPVSVWVKGQDLIVSNDCSHLSGAGRITEVIRLRQAVMRRMMAGGHYRDIVLMQPTGQTTETEVAVGETEGVMPQPTLPDDNEHLVYECYCELGSGTSSSLIGDLSALDRDERGRKPGFPLPYRVSIDVDSREVLEVRRNWKRGDKDYAPRRRYVKYGFVPSVGFYDLGLIHIVGNPTQAVTMIQRAMVDSAIFANFPAWVALKGPGTRQQNTVIRPGPGEVIAMDAAGASKIGDVLMPLPYKPPSAEAMALMQKLEADAKRLAGVIEIPVGEGRIGNTPVGTIMSYIEAVAQVPGAVHKDDHISQQDEFELLRELFAEDPEALWRSARRPARKWQIAKELLDPELVPSADPNTPSMIHRLMKIQGLVALGGMPQFMGMANNREIYRHAVRVLASDNPEEFELPEMPASAPPPDPKVLTAQIKAQADMAKVQAAQVKDQAQHEGRMVELAEEGHQRDADRESAERRAMMSAATAREKANADMALSHQDRAHDSALAAAGAGQTAGQAAFDRAHERERHLNEMALEQQKIAAQREATQATFAASMSAPDKGGDKS